MTPPTLTDCPVRPNSPSPGVPRLSGYQGFVCTHNRRISDRVSDEVTPLLNTPEVRVEDLTSDEWWRFLDPHFHPALNDSLASPKNYEVLTRVTFKNQKKKPVSLTHLLATLEGLSVIVRGHEGDVNCQEPENDRPRSELRRSGRLARNVVKCTWRTARLPEGCSMRGGLCFFEVCSVTLASST